MAAASLQAQLEEYGVLRELEAPRGGARVDIDFARTLQPVVEASARILQRLNAKTLGSLSEDDVDALFAGQTELLIRQLAEQLPEFSRLHPSIADHTLRVTLTCQILLDFERLSPRQRNLLLWSSLLHDIAKFYITLPDGKRVRDLAHPFRCAVVSARVFVRFGWAILQPDELKATFAKWAELTVAAKFVDPADPQAERHDNSKLPQIVEGIEAMFGRGTDASLILLLVLLHQSLPSVTRWPPASPLSDDHIKRFILPEILPIMSILMRADSAAYILDREHTRLRESFLADISGNLERVSFLVLGKPSPFGEPERPNVG